jgi:hypothetical protein
MNKIIFLIAALTFVGGSDIYAARKLFGSVKTVKNLTLKLANQKKMTHAYKNRLQKMGAQLKKEQSKVENAGLIGVAVGAPVVLLAGAGIYSLYLFDQIFLSR